MQQSAQPNRLEWSIISFERICSIAAVKVQLRRLIFLVPFSLTMVSNCAQVPVNEYGSIESCSDNGRLLSKEPCIVMGISLVNAEIDMAILCRLPLCLYGK